jgi:hypothetical protein
MNRRYVCRECGFTVSEMGLPDWSKHDFVNKNSLPPNEIPEYDQENDCEGFDLSEDYLAR